jgi:tetratricopeptide (TPR) repeat protein
MKLNDMDKALADYSEAIKRKPDEARYYSYRSYIYEVKGDIKNSMTDTDKVLKLDPKNQEATSRKKRLETLQSLRATPAPPAPAASTKTSPPAAHSPHKP